MLSVSMGWLRGSFRKCGEGAAIGKRRTIAGVINEIQRRSGPNSVHFLLFSAIFVCCSVCR